ncbi:polyamine aminopropyltransferase, partial [Chitinimonas sp.]|uniref:polyamine aminopropyltransferase n=1 Tax=Chitinimonas sp. TaxID=1934313 RepID=UPI0035B2F199
IGVYLFAIGVGSWVSRQVTRDLAALFIKVELAVGLIGGFSAAGLFWAFAWISGPFLVVLYALVFLIGALVGLEIPLVMRLLERRIEFKELVSQVLSVDYLGALAVSLLFPLWLAPHLGMVRTALLFGLFNVGIALWTLWLFRRELPGKRLWWQGGTVAALVLAGFAGAGQLSSLAENALYEDRIIFTATTPYQRIVLTRWRDDVRLFLNNNLQFSSRDEYRYHEALVHPALAGLPLARRVLVLGGGDGLALREILKYPAIESITLVELDPEMPALHKTHPVLRQLNGDAFHAAKVKVVNADAFRWLEGQRDSFDLIVVDFPDPTNYAVGKLYTNTFYRMAERALAPHGRMVVQSTSPLYGRAAFWTVADTIASVGLQVHPYHVHVPSFGEWGFVLASREAYTPPGQLPSGLRFLTVAGIPAMFQFPPDMAHVPTEINRLNNQSLVHVFEHEWRQVLR